MPTWAIALLLKPLLVVVPLTLFFTAHKLAAWLHRVIPEGRIKSVLFSRVRD